METPTWLAPVPSHSTAVRMVNEAVFESIFESTVDRTAMGHRLKDILSDDPRQLDMPTFMRWIARDKQRAKAFAEAKRMGTHMVMEEMLEIADGKDSMEDVARSTLRVNTRRIYLKAYNPQVFGDNQSLSDTTGGTGGVTININAVTSPYATAAQSSPNVEIIDNE